MSQEITLNYNHIKRKVYIPEDEEDLLESFFNKFDADKTKKYIFKYEDETGEQKIMTNNDICPSNFKENMEIIVEEEKEIIILQKTIEKKVKRKSGSSSSLSLENEDKGGVEKKLNKREEQMEGKNSEDKINNMDNEDNGEDKSEEGEKIVKIKEKEIIMEKKVEKEIELNEKDIEKQIKQIIDENRKNALNNLTKENDNKKLESELKKLENELKGKEVNKINYEQELKNLKKKYEQKNIQNDEEIKNLIEKNKQLQNKLNELQLQLTSKTANPIIKKKKDKQNSLIYIKKSFDDYKKEREKKYKYDEIFTNNMKKEEDKMEEIMKKNVKKLLNKSQVNNNINIKINHENNIQNEEFEENENLTLLKEEMKEKLENLKNEKILKEKEYKKKIEDLKEDLIKKKQLKLEMENKRKEEEILAKELEEKQKSELKMKLLAEEEKKKKILEENKKVELDKNNQIKKEKQLNSFNNNIKKENLSKVPESNPINQSDNKDFLPKRKDTLRQTSAKKVYSFECTNILNLQQIIYQGTDSAEIPIIMKNTGKFIWPQNNTKLVFDPKSKIKGKSVLLKPLANNEEQKCIIVIDDLAKLGEGIYDASVWFNVNGENCGKKLTLRVEIIKKEEEPMNENLEILEKFRKEFNLDNKDDYPDNYLLDILTEADFNFEDAFMKVIG